MNRNRRNKHRATFGSAWAERHPDPEPVGLAAIAAFNAVREAVQRFTDGFRRLAKLVRDDFTEAS